MRHLQEVSIRSFLLDQCPQCRMVDAALEKGWAFCKILSGRHCAAFQASNAREMMDRDVAAVQVLCARANDCLVFFAGHDLQYIRADLDDGMVFFYLPAEGKVAAYSPGRKTITILDRKTFSTLLGRSASESGPEPPEGRSGART